MAGFQYRLKQVFNLRERKKKEQEERVIQAQQVLREVQLRLEAKIEEIKTARKNMMLVHHTLMSATDAFIDRLEKEDLIKLYLEVSVAENDLAYQKKLLIKAQSDLDTLIKHREKVFEEWKEEEKRREMKQMDEVASQRYFRAQLAQHEDDLLDAAMNNPDE